MARTRHLHRAGTRLSLSWSLRNAVVRARYLGRAAVPPTESFLIEKGGRGCAMQRVRPHGLSSPGFQAMVDEILHANDGNRPEFEGSHIQFVVDPNELVSAPSRTFMALGGTPPSAHMPDPSWRMPLPAPALVSTPPSSSAHGGYNDQAPVRGRGRWIPRRRSCDAREHI
ncbi:hypothetical protein PIB30_096948 [Stylosanthes scabra]|uniref:Uncharacterized protein n=1 Tax=Stylosanthes scabra TaxID=79078 RepID=A0ABU6ZVH4_9FABA|nr:hypothetical protein [Stylosanthes scabra]